MRVLIFHGYLLGGTGSNVYNARLAAALVRLGHEVHLFSQDRHPELHPFVRTAGNWDGGVLTMTPLDRPGANDVGVPGEGTGRCLVYRPNIGGLLPVYVQDRYEGIQAKTFANCTDAEIAAYLGANVEAVREVAERVRPELALANHLVMGPVILARALAGGVPYAVKVHGSALEYTVKPDPERFLGFAREGLAGATSVLVGSEHTAVSLWNALDDPALRKRTRLGPPGVEVEQFRPREPGDVAAGMRGLLDELRHGEPVLPEGPPSAFARDDRATAAALERLLGGAGEMVGFVGKLIVSKGVDLLVTAWPLVLQSVPSARLAIVGFGAYREAIEHLIACLSTGDLDGVGRIAQAGRALERHDAPPSGADAPGESAPLSHLLAFLGSLSSVEAQRYRSAAVAVGERIVLTGRLDHEELVHVLPACEALVVPSTFPEAFGMVAAEAAACGVLPISAAHSGLAEVSGALAEELPPQSARWLSFPVDEHAVRAIADRVCGWLQADRALKAQTRAGLVSVARRRWSWEGVALGVLDAARGEPVTRSFG